MSAELDKNFNALLEKVGTPKFMGSRDNLWYCVCDSCFTESQFEENNVDAIEPLIKLDTSNGGIAVCEDCELVLNQYGHWVDIGGTD